MSLWTWYWLGWLIAVFAGFLPVEIYAIVTKNGHTLSSTMWHWADVNLAHPWEIWTWTPAHWMLAAFMIWLTLHLVWGYLR